MMSPFSCRTTDVRFGRRRELPRRRPLFHQTEQLRSMKNLSIILLLAFYLLFTVGVTVAVHTCGSDATAAVVTGQVEDPCGCSDTPSDEMCCTTSVTTLKIDDSQSVSSCAPCEQLTLLGTVPTAVIAAPVLQDHTNNSFSALDPSPPPSDDLCIVHSIFRI